MRSRGCWLAWACAAWLAAIARIAAAQGVYRCTAADGALAWQDHPCAAGQHQQEVALAPAPAWSPSPEYRAAAAAPVASRPRARERSAPTVTSWQCHAANGEVFYRHSRCPATIRDTHERAAIRVTATPLPRREACRHIAWGTHDGHARDETVSSYERNLGNDPCRRW